MCYRFFVVASLLMILFGVGTRPCVADVEEAESTIADRRIVKIVEAFPQSSLKLPDTLQTDQDIFVITLAGAAYTDVRLLARPTVDATNLAKTLETAVAGTSLSQSAITYFHDSDYATARAQFSRGNLGAQVSSNSVPIGKIVSGLRESGYLPHALLILPPYLTANATGLPLEKRPRALWYDATNMAPDQSITLQARMTPGVLLLALVFVFLVPVVGIAGLLTAIIYGNQQHIPIKTRRQWYPKLATWPTFGAIALHFPFVLFYLRSPGPRLLGDLWFGSSTIAGVFAPFLVSGPIVMMLLLPITKKVEQRIFGPSEDTSTPTAPPPPTISPAEKQIRLQNFFLSLIPTVIGLGLMALSNVPSLRHHPLKPFLSPLAMVLLFTGPTLLSTRLN